MHVSGRNGDIDLVCRGKIEKVTVQADVYSFGVVLWELVTGESPRFGQAWYREPRQASITSLDEHIHVY